MELVDTHSHLFALDDSVDEVIDRAYKSQVTKMICVGSSTGITSASEAVEIANSYDNVWASVGIHPHSAQDFEELEALEVYMSNPKVVAIGETGLDFFKNWSPFDAQERLLKNTIAFALNHNKPLIIHCREAKERTLQILQEMKAYKVGGVFHCYVEDAEFAKRLEGIGFKISLTGIITFAKAESLRDAAREIPLSQIMLETDCPYMAPTPFRGKPSEPMHVRQIAEKLAEIKELELEEVATQTTINAINLFGIS